MVEEDGWMDLLCEWSGEVEGELAGAGVFLVWRWRSLKVLSSGTCSGTHGHGEGHFDFLFFGFLLFAVI